MQTPSAPPAPPQAPTAVPAPAAITPGAAIAQVTEQSFLSYNQLLARGEELSQQLRSATSRRAELSRDLRRASNPAMQDGLKSQMTELNSRIVQLEKSIDLNGQLRVQAKGLQAAGGSTASGRPASDFRPSGGDITAMSVVFTLFVLCPIAVSISRMIWKRTTRYGMAPPASRESDMRMERVEQAVDAIAVEVERISEGQRFVTQLMTQQPALGEGAAQPVRVAANDPVMASWQQR